MDFLNMGGSKNITSIWERQRDSKFTVLDWKYVFVFSLQTVYQHNERLIDVLRAPFCGSIADCPSISAAKYIYFGCFYCFLLF